MRQWEGVGALGEDSVGAFAQDTILHLKFQT